MFYFSNLLDVLEMLFYFNMLGFLVISCFHVIGLSLCLLTVNVAAVTTSIKYLSVYVEFSKM